MKLASEWGDELATCRSLELQFVYNRANCKRSDCSISIWMKLSRRAQIGNILIWLMIKQDKDFFSIQVKLPRTDLKKNSGAPWPDCQQSYIDNFISWDRKPLLQTSQPWACSSAVWTEQLNPKWKFLFLLAVSEAPQHWTAPWPSLL